ncbi:MAG: methyltransferase domain-containing protein [Desulfamplus sp.]|nr:methyltransferase domain-containing protein [Desulfamplus sp.]
MRKQYIEVPLPMSSSLFYKFWAGLKGILLSPIYLVMAAVKRLPGISFHLRCIATGLFFLVTRRVALKTCYRFLFFPMDSTRYFEFYEVWKRVKNFAFKNYLDVSSPRLMPLFILKAVPAATAKLINPDFSDLKETKKLANALGLKSRCEFFNTTLDDAEFEPDSFDLITCISVLEHIPNDKAVIETMWTLLRPGGKLILTLPCMSRPVEQYISHNPYGLLNPEDDGYTFWQRYYDPERLKSSIYSIIGMPTHIAVYGEKQYGFFFRNASMKRLLGSRYPFWREPYMMADEYQSFLSIEELPGEGVVILEFIKHGGYI